MSCEIHDDQWHCFLQEGEWVHIKKEEWNKSEMEPKEVIFKHEFVSKGELDSEIEFKPNTPESYGGKTRFIMDEVGLTKPFDGVELKRFIRDEAPGINEEQAKEIFPEIKPKTQFNPFGKIWDIINGEG